MSDQKLNEGIKSILSKLEDEELYSLQKTVTQGLLKDKICDRESKFFNYIMYMDCDKYHFVFFVFRSY